MNGPIYRFLFLALLGLEAITLAPLAFGEQSSALPALAMIEPPAAELAEHMTQLQVYTHKLSLSLAANNRPLARFYLHESVAKLKQMQEIFPEYEGQPIALLIDRLALESYQPLDTLLRQADTATSSQGFDHALEVIVKACNACHLSCEAPIRIQRNHSNPFMQDFNP